MNLTPEGKPPPTLYSSAKIKPSLFEKEPRRRWRAGGQLSGTEMSEAEVIFKEGEFLSGRGGSTKEFFWPNQTSLEAILGFIFINSLLFFLYVQGPSYATHEFIHILLTYLRFVSRFFTSEYIFVKQTKSITWSSCHCCQKTVHVDLDVVLVVAL